MAVNPEPRVRFENVAFAATLDGAIEAVTPLSPVVAKFPRVPGLPTKGVDRSGDGVSANALAAPSHWYRAVGEPSATKTARVKQNAEIERIVVWKLEVEWATECLAWEIRFM